MHFSRHLVVLAVALAAPSTFAQPAAVLMTQEPLPGSPGWTVTDVLEAPVVRGDLTATVVSTNNPAIGTRQAIVVWNRASGLATRLAPDSVVNGRAINSIAAASLRVDDLGRVLIVARDGVGDRLLRISASATETLLSNGDAVTGMPSGYVLTQLSGIAALDSSLRVNGSSVALFAGLTGAVAPNLRALVQLTPSRIYLREGGIVGSNGIEQLSAISLGGDGSTASLSSLSAATNAQALWLGATPTLTALTGQSLPLATTPPATLLAIDAWSMSTAGVAVRARADASGSLVRGLWAAAGPGAPFARRAIEGDVIPALGTIAALGDPALAADGSITLAVRVTGPDITPLNDVALVRIGTGGIAGGVTILAREGTPLTDGSGAPPSLEPLMLASPKLVLAGGAVGWLGDSAGQPAVFLAGPTQTARLLGPGQSVTSSLGSATINTLAWPTGLTGGDDGRPSALSPTLAAARATITTPAGPRTAVVTTTLGPPRCGRADVAGANQAVGPSGSLTADDIIVFLGWYFANDLRADLAGPNQVPMPNGTLTADDIIVFLGAFFAGC